MRMTVLGAGHQGSACVFDWVRQPDVTEVTVIDSDAERLDALERRFSDGRIRTVRADVGDSEALVDALRGSAGAVSAVPYFLNVAVTRAAIRARAPLADMGGNTEVVFQQRALDDEARSAGIAILPDQGLAPGLAGILAAHGIRDMDEVESIRMRAGGLPQKPQRPLGYALLFSIHGLLNEYSGEAVILEDGRVARKPTLTGLEEIRFPWPVGVCQAAYTSGGTSTLPWTLQGKVANLDYKTVRYPGHWTRVAFLKEMGLLDAAPTQVGRIKVAPKDLLATLLEPRLSLPDTRDIVVLRVRVTGSREGRTVVRRFDLLDRFDEVAGLTAMMRTTAFPASESALLLARGRIARTGVLAAEEVVPGEPYIRSLRSRGLAIRETDLVVHAGEED
jgi:lysine 6-dehydrogenase